MTSLVEAKRSVSSLFSWSLTDNNQWGADRTIRGERDKDIAFPPGHIVPVFKANSMFWKIAMVSVFFSKGYKGSL